MLASPKSLSQEYPQPGEIWVSLENYNTVEIILESAKPTSVGSNRNWEVLERKRKRKKKKQSKNILYILWKGLCQFFLPRCEEYKCLKEVR